MMNQFLVEMLGVNAPDWDYLDESAKCLFLNSGFALLSSFCQSSLDTEDVFEQSRIFGAGLQN